MRFFPFCFLLAFFVFVLPAKAATICVGAAPAGTVCDDTKAATGAELKTALQEAGTSPGIDTVHVGPGTYTASNISYNSANPVRIVGAGADQVTVTIPDTTGVNTIFRAVDLATSGSRSTLSGIGISIPANADVASEYGLSAARFAISNVKVFSSATDNSTAFYLHNSSLDNSEADLNTSANGNYGFTLNENAPDGLAESVEVTSTTIEAPVPLRLSSTTQETSFFMDRSTLINNASDEKGVWSDAIVGPAQISNTLIQTQNNSEAIEMRNLNAGAYPINLELENVTLRRFQPGNGVSILVQADDGAESALLEMSGVLFSGYSVPISIRADNGRTAAVTSTYSAFNPAAVEQFNDINSDLTLGTTSLTETDTVTAAPIFVDAAGGNFRPAESSPMIDVGGPATSFNANLLDLGGTPRAYSGTGSCTVRRDVGAYEFQPPQQSFTAVTGPAENVPLAASPTFSFEGSWNCPGAQFVCSVDGGSEVPCTSPSALPALSDGAHTFSVRALESGGGLQSDAVVRSFLIDTLAPPTPLLLEAPPALTNKRDVTFVFSGEGQLECGLEALESCASPQTYKGLSDGNYTFSLRAKDAAGNQSPEESYVFRVDATAPRVVIKGKSRFKAKGRRAKVKLRIVSSEETTNTCNIKGKKYKPCFDVFRVKLPRGRYILRVRSRDAAGNASSSTKPFWVV